MKKLLSALILIALLSLVHRVTAQMDPDPGMGGIDFCSRINNNLQLGSSDTTPAGQVAKLQIFLVNERYLVMPTGVSYGYFGNATRQAVIKFQTTNNISPAVGFVGSLTRAKILQVSCARNNSSAPHIDSIFPSSVTAGTATVELNGQFSATDQVKFGDKVISTQKYDVVPIVNCAECQGPRRFTFNMPSNLTPGIYSVSVFNSISTSNAVNFTFVGTTSPQINSISPSSGPTRSRVTLSGNNFTFHDNYVFFEDKFVANADSWGKDLSFDLNNLTRYCDPSPNSGACPQNVETPESGRTYSVRVKNANGNSNSVNFTVTAGIVSPHIDSLSATRGMVGDTIAVHGSGFTADINDINKVYFNGQYIGSGLDSPNHRFAVPNMPLGTYSVTIKNSGGTSNPVNFSIVFVGTI